MESQKAQMKDQEKVIRLLKKKLKKTIDVNQAQKAEIALLHSQRKSQKGTPHTSTKNHSPQNELNTSLNMSGLHFQHRNYEILFRREDINRYYKPLKRDNKIKQQKISSTENQLKEEHKLFEGNYFNTTCEQTVDLKIYLKIDEQAGAVTGYYHDRQIEYEVYGYVDSDRKQIIIGLIKRPLLVIVG